MNNVKFSIKKIKGISSDPKILYTKAIFYMKLGKISEAMDLLTQASINNYSKAQYTLAKLYHGDGNIEEAEKWYKLAFKNEV